MESGKTLIAQEDLSQWTTIVIPDNNCYTGQHLLNWTTLLIADNTTLIGEHLTCYTRQQ